MRARGGKDFAVFRDLAAGRAATQGLVDGGLGYPDQPGQFRLREQQALLSVSWRSGRVAEQLEQCPGQPLLGVPAAKIDAVPGCRAQLGRDRAVEADRDRRIPAEAVVEFCLGQDPG
jgi:hypothetical protein